MTIIEDTTSFLFRPIRFTVWNLICLNVMLFWWIFRGLGGSKNNDKERT